MDDFDLLDATIDPTDVKSMEKKHDLESEIEYEQIKIKAKMLWKIGFSDSNPLKVDEWKQFIRRRAAIYLIATFT